VIASRFSKLPIDFTHAEAVTTLPRHHDDPFDRMLVAQALSERLTLVTHDGRFAPYAIKIVWT
jgi:PIN domain nuclease of toxin-antitoxin system